MRPESLKFTAFGPYLEEQFIDFSSLNSSGLFLISGETGSGKTVILDAITYALYGKSSGGVRGDIYEMRCLNAPTSVNTEVEFVFSIHSKKYKFTRTLKFGRKNFNTFQNVLVLNDDGIFEPLFENPKASDLENTAIKLLGLTYEQFRQVVILPQGQFEQLLTSSSKDKEKILTSLFGTKIWEDVSRILYENILVKTKEISEKKTKTADILSENGCKNLEEFKSLLDEKEKILSEKNSQLFKASKELEEERAYFNEQNIIFEKFSNLEKNENDYDALKLNDENIENLKKKLDMEKTAEKLKPIYDSLSAAASQKDERKKAREEAKNSAEEKLKECDDNDLKIKELNNGEKEYEESKNRINTLIGMSETYKAADLILDELKEIENKVQLAEKAFEAAKEAADTAENEKHELEILQKKLSDEHDVLVNRYIMGFCKNLADKLKDGEPCPVCGSVNHPSPAKCGGDRVTDKMLEDADKKRKKTEKQLSNKTDEYIKASEKLVAAQKAFSALCTEFEKKKSEYNTVMKNTDSSIKSLHDLNEKINSLTSKTQEFEKKTKELSKEKLKLHAEYAAKEAAAKITEEEYEKADKKYTDALLSFNSALNDSPFKDEDDFKNALLSETEKTAFLDEISEHEINKESILKNILKLKEEIKNYKKPDIEALRKNLSETELNHKDLITKTTLADNEFKNASKVYSSLKSQTSKLEKEAKKVESDMIFAKRVRGDNGIGLQRYVLGIMLTSVTNEANRLLERVHGGRYKLYRSLDASGQSRIRGLEFFVYDSFSAKKRSVKTLSGGEKFLAALSLSIGLSSVIRAQSGGMEIGAMFIDEGFGTLDSSSITDALSVLSAMNRSNATIGIISHVAALKENIFTGIEITKTNKGSSLKIKQ